MSLFCESDIDYPLTVTVQRPQGDINESGDYQESLSTVISGMQADIQLSLKVRRLVSEDVSGIDDNAVWVMYCDPPVPILSGDRISDGTRLFLVDSAGDWGSHTECIMKLI